jgi:5-methylthioribose kinase
MEFDIENFTVLRDYLTQHGHVRMGEPVTFTKLAGGVSNRTVRVAWPDGHAWVLKQALPKLRVNVDWFSSPARIRVEAKALRWLNASAPPGTTPTFIFEDSEQDTQNFLLGMEAVPEEHENWKSILLSGQIVPSHFEQFGALLGTIHRKSSDASSQARTMFADTTYFENLRLDPYYLYTAQNLPAAAAFLTLLAQETLHRKDSLVHGDFSPKNTLVYRNKLILLDYEVVHFGDPAFDVGFALTHFLSKAHHLPEARAQLATAAKIFWQVYCGEIKRLPFTPTLEARAVRHTLACLLARVSGKSPLEYLTPEEMSRQREVALLLIANPPAGVSELIDKFINKIEVYAKN